ncbi:MAG TPA: zf-HC2 domain-containing protein [Actinomycetota bacterium]|nr:zf-HC2 domain-containing protein [Actinomycetota bacterium]
MPDHPDSEQLAAYQAGDGDRRQRTDVEAHLAGCPSCAEAVASVERARGRLALLEEPDLPAGLHDRLAAAVESEAARLATDGSAARPGRDGAGRRRGRPAPWYRRPVAWGAAAALLLAALVAVPLFDRSTDMTTAGDAGGGTEAAGPAADATGGAATVPLLQIPGEVSAAAVRSTLASDSRAKAAFDSAAARGAAAAGGTGVAGGDAAVPQTATREAPDSATSTRSPDEAGDLNRSSAPPAAGPASLRSCLPAATADAAPAIRPLTPVFYVEGIYQGREATILVTTSTGQQGRVDLWVFPRNDCSSPPLITERVR